MNNSWKNVLLANLNVEKYDAIHRKHILLSVLLIASAVGLSLFSFINIFFLHKYLVGLLNILALLVIIYAIFSMFVRKNIAFASYIMLVTMFVFFIVMVHFTRAENFTLIWTIFFPIISFVVMGSKKGMILNVIFYTILFSMAYQNIGIWQDALWTMEGFLRLSIASIILVYVLYLFEQNYEKAWIILEKTRTKEKEYIQQLHMCSITDPLTKLYNRRQMDHLFNELFEKAKAEESYFALCILDVDFFKNYNDTYGHHKGDEVLQNIANILQENMQHERAHYFRLGGDEFAGILTDSSQMNIFQSIDDIRVSIENLAMPHEANPYKVVTASFGVCMIHTFDLKDLEKMYKASDDFLYQAKKKGRNCVEGGLVQLV